MWKIYTLLVLSVFSNELLSRSPKVMQGRYSSAVPGSSYRTIIPKKNNNYIKNISPGKKAKSICQANICGDWNAEEILNYEEQKSGIEKKVNQAVRSLASQRLSQACHSFSKERQWSFGDQSLFVIDSSGYCYVNGSHKNMLWNAVSQGDLKAFDNLEPEGEWVLHGWDGKTQYSFIVPVFKGNELFFVGMGLYSDIPCLRLKHIFSAAEDIIKNEGVKSLCKNYILENKNSLVRVYGDVGLTIFDENGLVLADIGNIRDQVENIFDIQDHSGNFVYKQLKECMDGQKGEVETIYDSKQFKKVTVGKKILVPGSDYQQNDSVYIVGTYYPSVEPQAVIAFVSDSASHLRSHGPEAALRDFSNFYGQFTQEPLRAVVFDMNGIVCADSFNPNALGKNGNSVSGENYHLYLSKLLEKASKDEKGWMAFESELQGHSELYYQVVQTVGKPYIVCTVVHPFDRRHSIDIAARQTNELFESLSLPDVCSTIEYNSYKIASPYIHIDLYTPVGLCLASNDISQPWVEYKYKRDWADMKRLAMAGGGLYAVRRKEGNKQMYVRYIPLIKNMIENAGDQPKSKVIRHGRPPFVKREEIQNFADGVIVVAWYFL